MLEEIARNSSSPVYIGETAEVLCGVSGGNRDQVYRLRVVQKGVLGTKTTTLLAKTYQHILVEDLNVKGMMANQKLSDALSNLGLYRFRELLSYKQESFGFLLTIVDRTTEHCRVLSRWP